jgi:hypothetical protein
VEQAQQQPEQQQQQQQQAAWQHQPQECDAVAKLAVYVLTAWHQIFKIGWRMKKPVLDKQSCKQLLPCAALAAALLQTRPAVKWSLDDEDDEDDDNCQPKAYSSSGSRDTDSTRDQEGQQQQQAASWERRGLHPATGDSLWFDTEARLIRHLDGAAYSVGDLLRIVLAPLTAPAAAAAGVDKWSQLLLDSADVQLLLQASMAARLELAHMEMKGVSSVQQQPSLAQLAEGTAGTGTLNRSSTGGSSGSSSSSSKNRKAKQRKAEEQQQQQQHAVHYMRAPPFHTQLLDALGIPAFELRWAATPGAPADSPTSPGTHDRELKDAVSAVIIPSVLALRSLKTARALRELPATGRVVSLKLQRGVALPLLRCVVEACMLGAGPVVIMNGLMGLPDLAAAALQEAAATANSSSISSSSTSNRSSNTSSSSSSSSSNSSSAGAVLDAVVGLLGPAIIRQLQGDGQSSMDHQQKMQESLGQRYVHLLMTCRAGRTCAWHVIACDTGRAAVCRLLYHSGWPCAVVLPLCAYI